MDRNCGWRGWLSCPCRSYEKETEGKRGWAEGGGAGWGGACGWGTQGDQDVFWTDLFVTLCHRGTRRGQTASVHGSTKSVRVWHSWRMPVRVMDACVHLIIPLIAHLGINIPYRETQCKVNLSVGLSSHRGVYICVVESKAFDPNLCVCIIYSLIPASLCLFFKAGLRNWSGVGKEGEMTAKNIEEYSRKERLPPSPQWVNTTNHIKSITSNWSLWTFLEFSRKTLNSLECIVSESGISVKQRCPRALHYCAHQ